MNKRKLTVIIWCDITPLTDIKKSQAYRRLYYKFNIWQYMKGLIT